MIQPSEAGKLRRLFDPARYKWGHPVLSPDVVRTMPAMAVGAGALAVGAVGTIGSWLVWRDLQQLPQVLLVLTVFVVASAFLKTWTREVLFCVTPNENLNQKPLTASPPIVVIVFIWANVIFDAAVIVFSTSVFLFTVWRHFVLTPLG